MQDATIVIRQPGCALVESGSAAILQRYLERRAELALNCGRTAPLIVDLEGQPLSAERLQAHHEAARADTAKRRSSMRPQDANKAQAA